MELLVTWEFEGAAFEWSGDAAWHFVRVLADDVVRVELVIVDGDDGEGER